ncbi:DEAD/DEAH box helicase [Subtercola boreus]|nr:DEAD/DEAH box helicase [Subtercola boreus]
MRDYGHPDRVPTEEWFSSENTDKEKTSPWLDEDFNDARSLLFLAALDLHRSFIHDQRRILRSNLFAAYDVLMNAAPRSTDARAVRAAWESLFLVVPTVTTTFASLPRVFGSLQSERLGWLLIDEAGQAAPQHALCGIWRTSNSVLVGDPLQLQPVVSLPIVHQRTLLRMTGTSDRWLPASNPAQVLADRNARYVARIQVPGMDEITVGAPLRVHRRCDNPMFDVVNDSVYGGMMVHGGERTDAFMVGDSEAPPSAWFDVAGISWNGHNSLEQIALLDDVLGFLRRAGHPMSEILVISPFSDVARALRSSAIRFGMDASKQAGTIHTAQGKEADIVILVLGGHTSGARNWAAGTPNLFNVAVSRARRRIFVIGSHRDWATLPYFQHLAVALERHPATVDVNSLFDRAAFQNGASGSASRA